ncbi:ALG6, ALG8 glycosyltransferase [Ramicandelaber brevisporus]|nr:ALG6, ALG8 glycosyltransferase [Ramicandelaber brevisporus]
MELTYHLPIRQWYYFSPDHWRLDYPPLTAYVSWLCGFVGHHINPEWMALDTSRGFEDAQSKMFMRFTVIVLEYIVYIPAVVIFVKQVLMPSKLYSSSAPVMATLAVVLLQPALIIIDNAHFQYNSMMLGFTLWAVLLFGRQQYVLGSVFFCFALMFKQMALFYSPAIFFYLLGKCLLSPSFNGVPLGRIWLLTKIGIAVIATFVIMLAPFMSSTDDLLQVFKRIFPVARGLYEDKVANFWCAISIAVKLREKFELSTLMRGSAGMTALAFLPSVLHVFWYARKHLPTSTSSNSSSKKVLLYALVSCSLAFFMFSFQVHEKSILIPALPIVLLYPFERELVLIFVNTAMMSMFPLLKRVELSIPYAALLLLWNVLDGYPFLLVTLVIAVIHGLDLLVTPPERYPHIFIMLNMIFSAGVFGLTLLYLTYPSVCSIYRVQSTSWSMAISLHQTLDGFSTLAAVKPMCVHVGV